MLAVILVMRLDMGDSQEERLVACSFLQEIEGEVGYAIGPVAFELDFLHMLVKHIAAVSV